MASLVALALAGAALPAFAERLALRHYTTADGLPSDRVRALHYDSTGALWVGTDEGLARFDGQAFRVFTAAHGLPHATIQAITESRDGVLWVGTNAGLAWLALHGEGGVRFTPLRLDDRPGGAADGPNVIALAEAPDRRLWVGTTGGLYSVTRASSDPARWVASPVELPFDRVHSSAVNRRYVRALLPEPDGSLWAGGTNGVYHCDPRSRCRLMPDHGEMPNDIIHALAHDRWGRVWAGGRAPGIAVLVPESTGTSRPTMPSGAFEGTWHRDDLPPTWTMQLVQDPAGELWAATFAGVCRLETRDPGRPVVTSCWGKAHGFPSDAIQALAFTRTGVVFAADVERGLTRWDRHGAVTHADDPGLPPERIADFTQAADGSWIGLLRGDEPGLVEYRDGRFATARLKLPPNWSAPWWPQAIQARDGRFWVAASHGVCVFPPRDRVAALDGVRAERCFSTREGLSGDLVFGLFEDRAGDVWIGSQRDQPPSLVRWRRATGTFESFGPDSGLPECHFFRGFAEDPGGSLWIGCYAGGLVRFRGGRFQHFDRLAGMPANTPREILVDTQGRLWAALGTSGVVRCDRPQDDEPTFVRIGAAEGVSGTGGSALAADRAGRVYVANPQGLFRVRDAAVRAQRFGLEDGLPSLTTLDMLADREGFLWLATPDGVARFMPPPQRERTPPDPVFSDVRAGGLPLELPLLGRSHVGPIELAAERATVEIAVTATSLESGGRLRFQYRLDPLEPEFGAPSEHATRLYPSLSPGTYRIEVRTVDSSGTGSRAAASLALKVLSPWWQRGWFVAGLAAATTAIGYLFHRQRLRRGVMLERMRLRIATDLHDDLGSSLSSIAIQSDVMSRTAAGLSEQERARLQRVAASAAEMVETMSDIVWAVNPRFDRLSQLAHRMHRFARETLGATGVELRFDHRHPERDVELDSAARRQLYLIFKELVHNIAKHARAAHVEITIEMVRDEVRLGVKDDGCGFDRTAVAGRGLGLESLARRAASIGAEFELQSAPGGGTSARIVLRHRGR